MIMNYLFLYVTIHINLTNNIVVLKKPKPNEHIMDDSIYIKYLD